MMLSHRHEKNYGSSHRQQNDGGAMVIDEYLKFKPAEQTSTAGLKRDCPLNTPCQQKRLASRLPPLKASTSVESLQARGCAYGDEEMVSGGGCSSTRRGKGSQDSQKKRRNIDPSRLFANNSNCVNQQKNSSSHFSKQLSKQFNDTDLHHSLLKSKAGDTTLADTLLGATTMEEGATNNTTMFHSLHESHINVT